jgi:drug/metabolite transporter (DMT)-like permease
MVVPYMLIPWAELEIDSGVASVLISSMPLFTALIASALLPEETLTRRQVAGLALGFAGVVVVSGAGAASFADGGLIATLAVVLAAASYATGIVYARILLRRSEPMGLTGQQLLIGTVVAFAGVSIVGGIPSYSLSSEGWASLLALGILSTGIGMLGGFYLVRLVGSVRTSLVTYIVPIAGLTLGWAVLGESIGAHVIAGLLLIAGGVTMVLRGGGVAPVETRSASVAVISAVPVVEGPTRAA